MIFVKSISLGVVSATTISVSFTARIIGVSHLKGPSELKLKHSHSMFVMVGYPISRLQRFLCSLCLNPVYGSITPYLSETVDGSPVWVHIGCLNQYVKRHPPVSDYHTALRVVFEEFGHSTLFPESASPSAIRQAGRSLRMGKLREQEELEQLARDNRDKLDRVIQRNYDIAVKSSGLRRAAAIYRLWRNLGESYQLIAIIMRNRTGEEWSASIVEHICTELFTYLCNTSDTCVFKPMLGPITSPPKCKLDGCDNFVKCNQGSRRWNIFCSRAHSQEYSRNYPGTWKTLNTARFEARCMVILDKIRSGTIQYQTRLSSDGSLNSRIARRFESQGLIKRSKVLHNGRWTYRLEPLAADVQAVVL